MSESGRLRHGDRRPRTRVLAAAACQCCRRSGWRLTETIHTASASWTPCLVGRLHEAAAFERRPVVVAPLPRPIRELDLVTAPLLGRNQTQQMADAVEAGASLVIGRHDVPGRELRVRGFEHDVAGPRVLVPPAARAQIRRAQLPLAQRIADAGLEAALLLLVADLQPELHEHDAVVDDVFLELGTDLEETPVLGLGAEVH